MLDQKNTRRIDEKPKISTTHMATKNEDDRQSTSWMHEKPKNREPKERERKRERERDGETERRRDEAPVLG